MEKEPTQQDLTDFVSREVLSCQTYLVNHLLEKEIFNYDEIVNFYEYKCKECGGTLTQLDTNQCTELEIEYGSYRCDTCSMTYRESCIDNEIEQEPQEIYEWWLCSEWLLEKLEEQGEPIIRTDYGDWWGRTTTGQAIVLDYVIEVIWKEVQK